MTAELIESIKKLGGRRCGCWPHCVCGSSGVRSTEISWRRFFAGLLVAVFSLARAMTYLLEHHPIEIWAFFFGLIVASALLVARDVTRWNAASVVSLLCGIAVAWWITVASPSRAPRNVVGSFCAVGCCSPFCAMDAAPAYQGAIQSAVDGQIPVYSQCRFV